MAKLLFVVPTLGSYRGFLTELAVEACERGHEVHVATSFRSFDGDVLELSRHEPVSFHALDLPRGASPLRLFEASRDLSQLVKSIQPDWIQAHFSVAALVCALAKRKSWPFTSCVIQGLASTLARGFSRLLAYGGERIALLRLDEMWVLTRDDYAVVRSWNAKKARIQDSPGFGCRLDLFDTEAFPVTTRAHRRQEYDLADDELLLVFIGRFAAFKGFDSVVRSYWRLREKGASVRLLLIGSMDPMHRSGLTKRELSRLREDASILQPGWQAQVNDWLLISDLCVFPSEREGMPVCLMEALSMGVPVLTSDSRGCRDVVRHEVDGVVLRNPSSESLVGAVLHLLDNPQLLKDYRAAALANREFFDRGAFVAEHLKALEVNLYEASGMEKDV